MYDGRQGLPTREAREWSRTSFTTPPTVGDGFRACWVPSTGEMAVCAPTAGFLRFLRASDHQIAGSVELPGVQAVCWVPSRGLVATVDNNGRVALVDARQRRVVARSAPLGGPSAVGLSYIPGRDQLTWSGTQWQGVLMDAQTLAVAEQFTPTPGFTAYDRGTGLLYTAVQAVLRGYAFQDRRFDDAVLFPEDLRASNGIVSHPPTGRVLFGTYLPAGVGVYTPRSGQQPQRIALSHAPVGMCYASSNDRIYAAVPGASIVAAIRPSDLSVAVSVVTPQPVESVASSAVNGHLYAVRQAGEGVYAIRLSDHTIVATVPLT